MASRPSKPDAKSTANLDPEAALVQKVDEVRATRKKAEKAPTGGYTASSQLHRLEADLLEQLRELRKPMAKVQNAAESMSDDELVAAFLRDYDSLPPEARELVDDAIDARRQGRPALRVVERE